MRKILHIISGFLALLSIPIGIMVYFLLTFSQNVLPKSLFEIIGIFDYLLLWSFIPALIVYFATRPKGNTQPHAFMSDTVLSEGATKKSYSFWHQLVFISMGLSCLSWLIALIKFVSYNDTPDAAYTYLVSLFIFSGIFWTIVFVISRYARNHYKKMMDDFVDVNNTGRNDQVNL